MCFLVTFLPASPFIPSRQEQASRWVGWLFSLQLSEAPSPGRYLDETHGTWLSFIFPMNQVRQLDDGWPESEKDVFQAALRIVVKDSRWIVGQFRMSYGRIWCELDDGWPESEKDVFQAALSMVVVKNSRWMVGEFYMRYGGVSCEK